MTLTLQKESMTPYLDYSKETAISTKFYSWLDVMSTRLFMGISLKRITSYLNTWVILLSARLPLIGI
ncbi:hypothetical protein FOXYSP1_18585 [Fusarium oxysporum f. sp. phaseoli]